MTKRVAWFTGEPSAKECFTPHKVYEVVQEEATNFSVINDKGIQNFCLKKGCAHICHKDWMLADIVEEEKKVEEVEVEPVESKQPKWGKWIKNTTGKCPEGLKRKQKIKLKWSDGDKFVIDKPKDAAWYFSKGAYPVDITHYKVKLKCQKKPKTKWTKNTGVCPVDGNVKVEFKRRDGKKSTLEAYRCTWRLSGEDYDIIKWRLVD